MSQNNKGITIRARGIIIKDGKMLVVHMPHNDFYCLAGGNLEEGEDLKGCLSRELKEELGVFPEIGKLVYINIFTDREMNQSIDFIFEVTNGGDYVNIENLERTHAFEISELSWVSPDDDVKILPKEIAERFKNGKIIPEEVVFIKN